jgi:hypothetical protein
MAQIRQSHDERERLIFTDLEEHFPDFAGGALSWAKVPDGQDPPDFVGNGPNGPTGLELVEWLDGEQMTAAKGRESQRDQVHRVLASNWKDEYQPKNFRGVFLAIGNERISKKDEAPLRKQFFAFVAEVDSTWLTNPDRTGNSYAPMEFGSDYPLIAKYFSVRFIGGTPHGLCWIHEEGDGGAYDPMETVEALNMALNKKLTDYSTPRQQERLKAHRLNELALLVHHGFNAFAYNTPAGPLTLEEIVRQSATFYAGHADGKVFDRVWVFDSLDSATELNELIGFQPDAGRSRWLAEIWPNFRVYQARIR